MMASEHQIEVAASGGSGSGATFVATIANGIVTNVVVTNPGSGYLPARRWTLYCNLARVALKAAEGVKI
jgi:hypothetical protein